MLTAPGRRPHAPRLSALILRSLDQWGDGRGDPLLPKLDREDRDLRRWGQAQVQGALVLSVVVRSGPAETAVNGTLVARPVRRRR